MPKLWIMSDLHLEAVAFPDAFRPAAPAFDVLVLAGDVCEGDSDTALRVVARLARGRPAVLVLGNHEFWGREITRERQATRRAAERRRVMLLDDGIVALAGLRFVGGTLWADGGLAGPDATPALPTNEFIRVGRSGRPITGADEARLHRRTRRTIEGAMGQGAMGQGAMGQGAMGQGAIGQGAIGGGPPLVVVTHHAPHPLCLPAAHRSGWAAGNAASDLSALTDAGRIAVWVHGHHETVDLVRPGGTRIVCNPAGPGFINPAFRDDWVVGV